MLRADAGKPRQANLRRAVSTAYYAMFHALAENCATQLVGGKRTAPAWRQAYRALEHGFAKHACQNAHVMAKFPAEIDDFAVVFVRLQDRRHDADYDPLATFKRSEVNADIDAAEDAIARLKTAPAKDRRAFAAHVLFKRRP